MSDKIQYAQDSIPGGILYMPASTTSVVIKEPVLPILYLDPKILEAALRLGLTVELYLNIINKSPYDGVIYEDSGNDGINLYRSRTTSQPWNETAREAAEAERQRQDLAVAKSEEEAAHALDVILAPTLPSTWVGLTTNALDYKTGKAKNTTWGQIWDGTRLALDIAIPIAGYGLLRGARTGINLLDNTARNIYAPYGLLRNIQEARLPILEKVLSSLEPARNLKWHEKLMPDGRIANYSIEYRTIPERMHLIKSVPGESPIEVGYLTRLNNRFLGDYYGKGIGVEYLKSSEPGGGLLLYDFAVDDAVDSNNPGLIVARDLRQADKTLRTLRHYKNKIKIGDDGVYKYLKNGTTTENNPVYLLTQRSDRPLVTSETPHKILLCPPFQGPPKNTGTIRMLDASKELEVINAWREAAARGDEEAARKALDEWWKIKALDNKINGVVYHGSKRDFNVFDDTYQYVKPDEGYFFTTDQDYAAQFGKIKPFYLRSTKPELNTKDVFGTKVEIPMLRGCLLSRYQKGDSNFDALYGHDAITNEGLIPSKGIEYVVPYNKQIKLAKPFTYDDSGKLIDIQDRFNFSNPDVRYGLSIPITLGLGYTAAKALNNKKLNYSNLL